MKLLLLYKLTLPLNFNYPPALLRGIGHGAGKRSHLPHHVFKLLQHLDISNIRPRGKRVSVNRKSNHSTVVDYRSNEHRERDLLNQNNIVTITSKRVAAVKVGVLNCGSLRNKTASIVDHVIDSDLQCLVLAET